MLIKTYRTPKKHYSLDLHLGLACLASSKNVKGNLLLVSNHTLQNVMRQGFPAFWCNTYTKYSTMLLKIDIDVMERDKKCVLLGKYPRASQVRLNTFNKCSERSLILNKS